MWLTRLALRNPILILMMSLMLVTLGLMSLTRLGVDLFPDINVPVVQVGTVYAGASPTDIEVSISRPIERAVSSVPGVERVESDSSKGASIVKVWFHTGVNVDTAQFDVSERVSQIAGTLPPGIQRPSVSKFDVSTFAVAFLSLTGDGLSERQLYELAANTIQPQLERLPGVASVAIGGGQVRQIQVKVHRDALHTRGLAITDVVNVVRDANFLLPSGSMRTAERDYNVLVNTQVDRVRTLRDLVVRPGRDDPRGGRVPPVLLADVATIEDGIADQSNIVRFNGQRGVCIRIIKQPDANTIAVVEAVRAALPRLGGVPASAKLAVVIDQSRYIRSAVTSLEHEILQGALLGVLVVLLFLASMRGTLIVAVAIPLSLIATLVFLHVTHQTLNIFTLGGLALVVGRLVDDSIVELENIHRHLEAGQDRRQAILGAAEEVAMPILVSTLTTIVVCLPVLFLRGLARSLFLPLTMTFSFALLVSFFVSRTVTPVLALHALRDGRPSKWGRSILRALDRVDQGYARALSFVLAHRAAVIVAVLVACGLALIPASRIGTEFFPKTDESQFGASFLAPVGTRVEKSERIAMRLEAMIRDLFGEAPGQPGRERAIFTSTFSDIGVPTGRAAAGSYGPHMGDVVVPMVPRRDRAISEVEAMNRLRQAVGDEFPGVQLYFGRGGLVTHILNLGSPTPLNLQILGQDLPEGSAHAKKILAGLQAARDADGAPIFTDLQVLREESYPELRVDVDRQRAGLLGLTERRVAETVLISLLGNTQISPIPFTDPRSGNEYFINVRLDDAFRSQVTDLRDLHLRTPSGAMVALSSVARVHRGSGPLVISRKHLQRTVEVAGNLAPGKDLGRAAAAVQQVLGQTVAPAGFSTRVAGQIAAQQEAFAGLGLAGLLALAFVYMVLASQFRSFLDPLLIIVSVPLGLVGVVLALYVTGTTLNVNSLMGVIMMIGIVVSNGVLLVDFANVLRGRGLPLHLATVEAARTRLRPILMTTLATVIGLLPMALGIGEGSEVNLPLARAVIGGLTISTALTLFLVPTLYVGLARFSRRFQADVAVLPDAPWDPLGPGSTLLATREGEILAGDATIVDLRCHHEWRGDAERDCD